VDLNEFGQGLEEALPLMVRPHEGPLPQTKNLVLRVIASNNERKKEQKTGEGK